MKKIRNLFSRFLPNDLVRKGQVSFPSFQYYCCIGCFAFVPRSLDRDFEYTVENENLPRFVNELVEKNETLFSVLNTFTYGAGLRNDTQFIRGKTF